MRVTRKKALVIANAVCSAHNYHIHTSPTGFRYRLVERADGTFMQVAVDPPWVGLPYHYNPKAKGTWLGVK